MEGNRNFIAQLLKSFQEFPADRKAVIIISAAVFIGALIFWMHSTASPEYSLLYGDLTLADSGEITAELQNNNIPYKISDGGRSVLVPSAMRDQARVDLAMSDVLPSGPVGFELFDKSNLGLTEFTQNVNKDRAITGELERTLKTIDGVDFARVHLNLPEPSPFIGDNQDATASVMLKLSSRTRTLAPSKVTAIQNLVATAIGGLEPGSITIIDDNANLLTKDMTGGEDEFAALPDQLATKRAFEAEEASKIKGILEKRFGPNNVAVGVSVDLDFDRVEKETKKYEPVEGTVKGVVNKEDLEDEKTKGDGGQNAQGVPGTASNVPGYPAASSGTYESSSSHEMKEYSVSESWEKTLVAQGEVQNMSVSVLINAEEQDDTLVGEVEQLVLAASNIDKTRGDIVSVKMMPFDTTYTDWMKGEEGKAQSAALISTLLKWAPTILVIIVAFVLFMRFMKPIKEGYKLPRVEEIVKDDEIELPPQDPEAMRKVRIREEITNIADNDPESAARILKTWLQE